MSMREYATFGRGLVIPEKYIETFVKKCEEWDGEYYGDNYKDFLNDITYGDVHFEGGNVLSFSECSGDFFDIDDKEYKIFGDEIDEEWFFIIEIKRYPSLYEQAYKNEDEIVEEFKNSVGHLFPEDFDYKKYLVSYHGTYWG